MIDGVRKRGGLAVAAVMLMLAMALPLVALGQGASVPKLGITPVGVEGSYFTLTLKAGERADLAVDLGNFGEATTKARAYAADAVTLVNGGFGLKEAGSKPTGVTTWLDFPDQTLAIPAKKAIRQPFTLSVPSDTAPGEYITGLAIQTVDPVPVGGNNGTPAAINFNQILRQAIAVVITVPGPRNPSLTIGQATFKASGSSGAISVALTNDGNVRVKPSGELVLKDASGKEVLKAPVQLGSIFAGMSTSLEIGLPQPLPVGDYQLSLTLADKDNNLNVAADALPVAVTTLLAGPTPPSVDELKITPNLDAGGKVTYVDVAATVTSPNGQIAGARVVLHVARDGQPVENYVLGQGLTLPAGPSTISQRYIPAGGWTPGSYTFTVTLERDDPNGGQPQVLAQGKAAAPLVVK